MKAAVVRILGQPPRWEDIAGPPEGEGVLVDVLAAALSPRVRSGASGTHYTGTAPLPFVPGLDGVGRFPDGRRRYFLAANDAWGTMAEQTRAHPSLTVALPDHVSAATVAAVMIPAISSWVALTERVQIQAGQSVLVLGATGVAGQLAVQIVKHLGGGRVVAAGRESHALDRVRSLGADQVVRLNGDSTDGISVARAASDVDIVLDYLWGSVASAVLPELCRQRVAESTALHWVAIGSAAGDVVPLSSVLLRKRNLHVLGSGQGATSTADMFAVAPQIVEACATGILQIDIREVPLAGVERYWLMKEPSGERVVFIP